MENSVLTPVVLARSTSKYGRSSVAAGTSSIVQITAALGRAPKRRPTKAKQIEIFRIILSLKNWPNDRQESTRPLRRKLSRVGRIEQSRADRKSARLGGGRGRAYGMKT